MANKTVGYLAGDAEESRTNFVAGQAVSVALPATPRFPTYTLQGPGVSGSQAVVPRAEDQVELPLPQAVTPGNYRLVGGDGKPAAGFSLNVAPDESVLARVAPEPIEALLGPGALLPVGHATSFREALQGHWGQPLELLPWLMLAVLLVLAVENLLANKFYRGEPQAAEAPRAETDVIDH
jgi:hypothetical protein